MSGVVYNPSNDGVTANPGVYYEGSGTAQQGGTATSGSSQGMFDYGGYAGGLANTGSWLSNLQKTQQNQAAPQASMGQTNGYIGQAGQVGNNQNWNVGAYNTQIGQLQNIANGGTTAADTALQTGLSSGAAAQQAMARSGPTGVTQSASARGAAGNNSQAAIQTAQNAGQLKYNEEMGAQQGLSAAYAGQAGALSGERGQDLSTAQLQAQDAQFQTGMNQQQQFLNGQAGYGYAQDILGMNQQNQNAANQMQENWQNYTTGNEAINQNYNQAAGAAMVGAGGGLMSGTGQVGQSWMGGGAGSAGAGA